MYLEDPAGEASMGKPPAAPLPRIGKETLIPAIICAGLCVVLVRAGLLVVFFLVPLGVCAAAFGPVAAWLGAVFAVLGNGAVSAAAASYRGVGLTGVGLSVLYFSVMSLGFIWIMAGNPPESRWIPAIPRVRTLFRFIAAAVAGACAYMSLTFLPGGGYGFRSQIEAVYSLYIASSGADAAERTLLEQALTTDRMFELFSMIIMRGGAVVSAFFVFFYSRQLAFVFTRLFRRQQSPSDLIGFHVPRRAIWVLSLCLPVILLCRTMSLGMIEIAAWNLLVICAIMFFAQGGGIALFYLARRPRSILMRLLGMALVVCVIFSPGINVLAVTMLILLGIAENWLPLRVVRQETPGMDG
jgi:hypothetical protein